MAKRSKGIKRITLIISILAVIGWILFVVITSRSFSNMTPLGWLITIGGLFVAYFIPQLICKAVYWVIDGFEEDKKT